MEKFEDDLLEMVKNIKFRKVHDEFQDSLREDIKRINNSTKALIFADKTTNLYELEKTQCDKLLHNSITSTYKKADEKVIDDINLEAFSSSYKFVVLSAKIKAFVELFILFMSSLNESWNSSCTF